MKKKSSNAMLGEKQQDIKILCHNYNLSVHTHEYFKGNPEEHGGQGTI